MRTILRTIAIGAVLGGAAACSDGGPAGDASLTLQLTDAGAEYIDAAWVDIGRVEVIPADEGAPMLVTEDGTDGEVNLLDLTGLTAQTMGSMDFEAGTTLHQVRLFVESARVKLKAPWEFNGGGDERTLTVPSGAQTGIKLNLQGSDGDEGGFVVPEGETVLVVDFDVNRSFVLQGNPETEAGVSGVHFQPTLRVVLRDVAGGISGQVATDLGVDVNGLIVTAVPTTESFMEIYQTQEASGLTTGEAEAAGSYDLVYLVPGTYNVSVALPEDPAYADLVVQPAVQEVVVGEGAMVTDIDFQIVESAGGR